MKVSYNPQVAPQISRSSVTRVMQDKNHDNEAIDSDKNVKNGGFREVSVNPYQRSSNVLLGNTLNQVKSLESTVTTQNRVNRPRTAVSRPKTAHSHISSNISQSICNKNSIQEQSIRVQDKVSSVQGTAASVDLSRMQWLEQQLDQQKCKAEERDRVVSQYQNARLTLNEQEQAIRALRNENSELQSNIKALLMHRQGEITALTSDIESKYEMHLSRLTEDNRELSRLHVVDQERQVSLEGLADERSSEIELLRDILFKKDAEVRRVCLQDEENKDLVAKQSARIERIEMELRLAQANNEEQKAHCAVQKEQIRGLHTEAALERSKVSQQDIRIASLNQEVLVMRSERADAERSMREAWQRSAAVEEQAKTQIEGLRDALGKAEVTKKESKFIEGRLQQEQEKTKDLDDQLKKIKEQMTQLEGSRDNYRAANNALSEQVDVQTREAERALAHREEAARRTAELETDVRHLQGRLAEEHKNSETSGRMLERYKEMYFEARSQANVLEQKTIELQKVAEKHETLIESAKEMRADSQNTLNLAHMKVQEADNQVRELRSAKTLLEHDAESRIKELRAITKQYLSLHSEYSSVSAELGVLKTQLQYKNGS